MHYVNNILNKYIPLYAGKDADNATPLVSISTKSNTYNDNGNPLLCLAHPLQISTDPTKVLIKGDLWINGKVRNSKARKGFGVIDSMIWVTKELYTCPVLPV